MFFNEPEISDLGPTESLLEDFYALKNPLILAEYEPATLRFRGEHVNPGPPYQK